jgi:RNA polymerase sigma-70 factor, ECF subfamily
MSKGAEELKAREAELAGMFEQYYDKIARYVRVHIGNRMAAEDIAGDVFLKALKALPTYRERGLPMNAWLFRIAHNLTVDYLRQKERHNDTDIEGIDVPSSANLSQEVEIKLEMERVKKAMDGLSPSEREVVSLRFMSELSSKEVAAAMHKSDGAVRQMQSSAIAKLRQMLVENA